MKRKRVAHSRSKTPKAPAAPTVQQLEERLGILLRLLGLNITQLLNHRRTQK